MLKTKKNNEGKKEDENDAGVPLWDETKLSATGPQEKGNYT